MPYVEGRTVHDADSHIVETPDFLEPFLASRVRERMPKLGLSAVRPGEGEIGQQPHPFGLGQHLVEGRSGTPLQIDGPEDAKSAQPVPGAQVTLG